MRALAAASADGCESSKLSSFPARARQSPSPPEESVGCCAIHHSFLRRDIGRLLLRVLLVIRASVTSTARSVGENRGRATWRFGTTS
jgi:hypothetical protein